MGRYIESKINGDWQIVWKYAFGVQPSEMYRIYEDLEIGEYHPVRITFEEDASGKRRVYEYLETRRGADADILIIQKSDAAKLSEWIEVLKGGFLPGKEGSYFVGMLEAILTFMTTHANCEELTFEGEF